MSILNRLSRDEIRSGFTHYGWFAGVVPVYVGAAESDCPALVERNWVPEWWFSLVETLFGGACFIASIIDPEFEAVFPILLTGKIEP